MKNSDTGFNGSRTRRQAIGGTPAKHSRSRETTSKKATLKAEQGSLKQIWSKFDEGSTTDNWHFDVVVLGAGPAGLAAAQMQAPTSRTLVIDASPHCGGSHKSTLIDRRTFDSGSFFFENLHPWFEDNPPLRNMFVPAVRRQRRIDPRGVLRDYPFEPRELVDWPLRKQMSVVADYLSPKRAFAKPSTSAGDAARRVIGKTAFEFSGLARYVARLNELDSDEIDVSFFNARMGYLKEQTSPRHIAQLISRGLMRKSIRRVPPTPLFVRPAAGFDVVYDVLRESLEAKGVSFALGQAVQTIDRVDGEFAIGMKNGGQHVHADRVISAMPLEQSYRAAFGKSSGLASRDLLTLFVTAPRRSDNDRKRTGNVLFNFHGDGLWKRLTMHSDFYDPDADRSFFSVEITMRQGHPVESQEAFEDFYRHVTALGVFDSELRLEGHDLTKDAYPLLSTGSSEMRQQAVSELATAGLETVGRQGRFSYLPTSGQVIRSTRKRLEVDS